MDDLVQRLRKRAEIRRQISTRKSVQEGKPDRIADLLEEASDYIVGLERQIATHSVDWEAEAADARMDAIMLLENLKVAVQHLERERGNYRLTPVYLEAAIQNLKQTARDYDFKLKA